MVSIDACHVAQTKYSIVGKGKSYKAPATFCVIFCNHHLFLLCGTLFSKIVRYFSIRSTPHGQNINHDILRWSKGHVVTLLKSADGSTTIFQPPSTYLFSHFSKCRLVFSDFLINIERFLIFRYNTCVFVSLNFL